MIESFQEFVDLVERDDEESRFRLRKEAAPVFVWKEVISKRADLKRVVSRNKILDDEVLRMLANDKDPLVRIDIAMKRKLPADLFELLAGDPDESVRARIACNEKTPENVLRHLLADESPIVIEAAKTRLGLP